MILSYTRVARNASLGLDTVGPQTEREDYPLDPAFKTVSATLVVSSVVYAQFHHFPCYDPLLLRIFRCAAPLSPVGLFLGVSGVWWSRYFVC